MTFDAHAYAIQTRRISEDGETYFKATVVELPHLATYESTAQEAYDVLIEDIEALHASALELGHPFPAPHADFTHAHSGRITLRLPRTLHRTLDEQALQEGVSLNLHAVTLLTEGATAKNVALHAGNSIRTIARNAITTAALMRGQDTEATHIVTTGYSSTSQVDFSENEDGKWTTRH